MVNAAATTANLTDIVNYEGRMIKIEPEFSEEELTEILNNEALHVVKREETTETALKNGCDRAEIILNDLISKEIDGTNVKDTLLTRIKLVQAVYSLPEHGIHAKKTYECRARTAYILARAYFILVAYTHLKDDLASSAPEREFHRDVAYTFLERAIYRYTEAVKYAKEDVKSLYSAEMIRVLKTNLVTYAREQAIEGKLHNLDSPKYAIVLDTPPVHPAKPTQRQVTISIDLRTTPRAEIPVPATTF